MNKFKNEMLMKLGGQEILLRPTFDNMAATETIVGALSYLAWKFSRASKGTISDRIQSMPSLTDCARIIFYNQAATKPDDQTKKLLSLEEIWTLVQVEGMQKVIQQITVFLARATAGAEKIDEIEAAELAAQAQVNVQANVQNQP